MNTKISITQSQKSQESSTPQLLKVGLVANILEWYEFSIYGYLAVTMGQLFLAPKNSTSGLIWAWFIFAFGYLARPMGSVFWGWLGDKVSHSYSLKASLLTMAIPTLLIGILPTYHNVGFLATLSLLVCRSIQGFAAGGELPVSACYIFENAPSRLRGFLCSTVATGSGIGMLTGSFIANLLYWNFTGEQILNGAWRLPYLVSIPMTLWIAYFRKGIFQPETLSSSEFKARFNLLDQLSNFPKLLKAGLVPLVFLVGFMEILCYVFLVWLPSYLTHFLNVSAKVAQSFNVIILLEVQICLLIIGYLSNRVGYKRLLILHTALIIFLTYPLFTALLRSTSSWYSLLAIHSIFAWFMSGVIAVMMETLGHAYPKTVRCSGMSITHTLGATLFGGTAPFVCTYMVGRTEFLLFPAFYMIFFGLLALLIILRLKPIKGSH